MSESDTSYRCQDDSQSANQRSVLSIHDQWEGRKLSGWLTVSHKKQFHFLLVASHEWVEAFPIWSSKSLIITTSYIFLPLEYKMDIWSPSGSTLCQMSWNGLRHSDKLKAFHPDPSKKGILAADCGFFVCDVCLDLMASHTLLTTNRMAHMYIVTNERPVLYGERWNVSGISGRLGGPAVRTHIRDGILGWEGRPRDRLQVYRAAINNQTNNLKSYYQDKKDQGSWKLKQILFHWMTLFKRRFIIGHLFVFMFQHKKA